MKQTIMATVAITAAAVWSEIASSTCYMMAADVPFARYEAAARAAASRTTSTSRSCAPGESKTYKPLELQRDRLPEAEDVPRVEALLDRDEPGEVRAVVGLRPTGEIGVDVVHVGLAGDV